MLLSFSASGTFNHARERQRLTPIKRQHHSAVSRLRQPLISAKTSWGHESGCSQPRSSRPSRKMGKVLTGVRSLSRWETIKIVLLALAISMALTAVGALLAIGVAHF